MSKFILSIAVFFTSFSIWAGVPDMPVLPEISQPTTVTILGEQAKNVYQSLAVKEQYVNPAAIGKEVITAIKSIGETLICEQYTELEVACPVCDGFFHNETYVCYATGVLLDIGAPQ